jgi:uncharacterized protein DUF5670
MCGHRSRRRESGLCRYAHRARVHKRTDTRCCGVYRCPMLTTVAIVLLVLWFLGIVTSTAMGGLIHILLVVAIVMLLIRVIQGRRLI